MPRFDEPAPLTNDTMQKLLAGIADPPPSIRPDLALTALHVTADSLRTWCGPVIFAFPVGAAAFA